MADFGPPQLHRLILEALPLAICAINREGKVLLWSAGAEQMTGYFRQELLGRPFPNNFHQENQEDSIICRKCANGMARLPRMPHSA